MTADNILNLLLVSVLVMSLMWPWPTEYWLCYLML